MYEKWLSEDSKSLEENKQAIKDLKKQIETVKASQDVHEQKLNEKADALGTKEDILMVLLLSHYARESTLMCLAEPALAID